MTNYVELTEKLKAERHKAQHIEFVAKNNELFKCFQQFENYKIKNNSFTLTAVLKDSTGFSSLSAIPNAKGDHSYTVIGARYDEGLYQLEQFDSSGNIIGISHYIDIDPLMCSVSEIISKI